MKLPRWFKKGTFSAFAKLMHAQKIRSSQLVAVVKRLGTAQWAAVAWNINFPEKDMASYLRPFLEDQETALQWHRQFPFDMIQEFQSDLERKAMIGEWGARFAHRLSAVLYVLERMAASQTCWLPTGGLMMRRWPHIHSATAFKTYVELPPRLGFHLENFENHPSAEKMADHFRGMAVHSLWVKTLSNTVHVAIPKIIEESGNLILSVAYPGKIAPFEMGGILYMPKNEFHVTVIGNAHQLVQAVQAAKGIDLKKAQAAVVAALNESVQGLTVRVHRSGNYRIVQKANERGPRQTIIELVDVDGLDILYHRLENALGISLMRIPAHITLFTFNDPQGIGINSQAVLDQFSRKPSEGEALMIGRAMQSTILLDHQKILDPKAFKSAVLFQKAA